MAHCHCHEVLEACYIATPTTWDHFRRGVECRHSAIAIVKGAILWLAYSAAQVLAQSRPWEHFSLKDCS